MHSDLLITNATVLTMDRSSTVIDDAAIAIADGRIVAVGPRRGVIDVYGQATRVIDAHAAIVLPGFVNLHAHLAMTLLRGWADDLDLAGFLDRVFPVEEALVSPEMIRAGVTLAVAESLLAGTTTALDMYFYPEVASEIARSASFRLANGPVVFSFPGPDRMDYADRMVHAEAALAKARAAEELFSGRWLCPHSTYTIEPSHLEEVRDLAARHGAGIHIHAAETAAEVATVVGRTGRRPVELLGDLGMLGPATVLAHAVHLTDHEIGLIASSGASVAHNPLSNMKLASGFARVPDLLRAGVVTGIGTDGTASSNDLDHYVGDALRFHGPQSTCG